MNRLPAIFTASLALLAFSPVAPAQTTTQSISPGAFTGSLVRYSDDSATLIDKDGKELVVAMTRDWTVSIPRQLSTATLAIGDFVASSTEPIDANSGKSVEMRIFEPGYERDHGNRPVGQKGYIETHGTVTAVKKTAAGVELDVSYPGGSRRLLVPDDLPVNRSVLQSRTVLKPGMAVRGLRRKEADGVYRAGRLVLVPEVSTKANSP